MKERTDHKLERLLDRELKRLPDLPAPETLVHRVMLAVHAKSREPWWKRAWPGWPRPVQCVSLLLLLVAAAGLAYGTVLGFSGLGRAIPFDAASRWVGDQLPGLDALATLGNAGVLVFKAAGQQLLLLGSLLVVGSYLICVGLTTVGYQLVFRRA
jgi:hypothetical protein